MNIATIPFTSLRYVDTKSTEICCWNAVSEHRDFPSFAAPFPGAFADIVQYGRSVLS